MLYVIVGLKVGIILSDSFSCIVQNICCHNKTINVVFDIICR